MRSFGIVSPQFWTGSTGKALRDKPTVQVLAVYLMTSPHSHMCGLFYIPLQYIAYETGLPTKTIKKGFETLQNEQFCYYDEGTEFVWVKEMCHWQLGPMKNGDNRAKGIQSWYQQLPANPFLSPFFDRYKDELLLPIRRDFTRASEGAIGGLVSPTYPSPVPVLSPVLEGGLGETKKPHGEFGHALLTDREHGKLVEKLNGSCDSYIARYDNWVHQAPSAKANGVKRQDRDAYSSILAWHAKDVAEGKAEARASPEEIHAKAEAHRIKIFGKGK